MPKLISKYNWGSELKNINETLYRQLNDSFTTVSQVVNTKPSSNVTTTDPIADTLFNNQFQEGDFWINKLTNNAWILTSRSTNTAVTWTKIT